MLTILMLLQVQNLPTARLFESFAAKNMVTKSRGMSFGGADNLIVEMDRWVEDNNSHPNRSLSFLTKIAKIISFGLIFLAVTDFALLEMSNE